MEKTELKKTISILYDMELNNYLMTRLISQIDRKLPLLGRHRQFSKVTKKDGSPAVFDAFLTKALTGGIICMIIGAVIGLFVGKGFWKTIGAVFEFGLYSAMGGAFLFGIIGAIRRNAEWKKEKEKIEKDYQNALEQRKLDIKLDKEKVESELIEINVLEEQKALIQKRLKEASVRLRTFYEKAGIDPKFRNIISMGYMDEFLRLGVSDSLDGVNGLYYLILKEMRMDQMQYTLNDISEKLDTVIDHQHRIYSELNGINTKCDNILECTIEDIRIAEKNNKLLQSTAINTSITAYNTERTARELEFQNFMFLLNS